MRFAFRLAAALAALLAFAAVAGAATARDGHRIAAEIRGIGGFAVADSHDTDPFVPNFTATLVPQYPTTATPVSIRLTGFSPYPGRCAQVVNPQVQNQGQISMTLWPSAEPCSSSVWTHTFELGQYPAGLQQVWFDLYYARVDSSGDTTRAVHSTIFQFSVAQDSVPPPPPSTPLPYVDNVVILANPGTGTFGRPICPGDSILVLFAGAFPNPCFELRYIELVPDPRMDPFPHPPIARLVVDTTGCHGGPCEPSRTPWNAGVMLPPMPIPGAQQLLVELSLGSCVSPLPPSPPPSYLAAFPFTVDRCSTTTLEPCVYGLFGHPNGFGACDANVSPGSPGRIQFLVKPSVALSGLQGQFHFDLPGLRIARITAIGPASGMRLTWTHTDTGAKFVLFAEHGAPIPASSWYTDGLPIPVLEIVVEQATSLLAAPVTRMSYSGLYGADELGRGVPLCRPLDWWRLAQEVAIICRDVECDRNADGRLDVRDLVLLVRCLNDLMLCDPRGADCNRDSLVDLADVMCCARRLLGQMPCRECGPDSSTVRHEPIELSLGQPVESEGEVRVPVRLTYAEKLGAARIAIDYPASRYQVAGAGLASSDAQWLDLHEVRDGRIVLGLIRIQPTPLLQVDQRVELVLRLRLRPGQAPGGALVASESELSGNDGVKLEFEQGETTLDLGGRATIDLSAARPNPFASETRFSLTLDRSASVELGIYDVGGRLVRTLHRGVLAAGVREFAWDGTNTDGSRAATGVYFYRATVAGNAASRKLVLMPGN